MVTHVKHGVAVRVFGSKFHKEPASLYILKLLLCSDVQQSSMDLGLFFWIARLVNFFVMVLKQHCTP